MTIKQSRRPDDAPAPQVLTPELRAEAEAIAAKYPNPRSALLPLLFLVQSVEGYVTDLLNQRAAEFVARYGAPDLVIANAGAGAGFVHGPA